MSVDEGRRLRFARESAGWQIQVAASILGVSRYNLEGMEWGFGDVSPDVRTAASAAYGVREEWLKTGDGAMEREGRHG